jgi:predicted ester cyclase
MCMSTLERQNIELIQRYFHEVWNRGVLDVLDEIIDPEYLNHSSNIPNPRPGPADLKPIVQAMRQAISNLHYEILDIVAGADKVAVHVRLTGTHTDTLFGMPAHGRPLDVPQMQIEWIRNGRIWQHWRLTDELSLLRQMGALPGQ